MNKQHNDYKVSRSMTILLILPWVVSLRNQGSSMDTSPSANISV